MSNGNTIVLEARIRRPDGTPVSKHYQNLAPKQVQKRAQRFGKVISIRKVDLWNIMGTSDRMRLRDVISPVRVQEDVFDTMTLENIVFGKSTKDKRRERLMRKGT